MGGSNGLDVWPEFLQLWQRFRRETDEVDAVVVVEGDRDRDALVGLGYRGQIALVHRGQSLSALAQELSIAGRRVVVLTDWDVQGGQIAHRLREFLSAGAVTLDLDFRRRLAHVLRGEVVHVEGLLGWARRMAERAGAPLDYFLNLEEQA